MRYKLLIAAMFLASGTVNAKTFISNSAMNLWRRMSLWQVMPKQRYIEQQG